MEAVKTQLLMTLASMPFILAWRLPFTPLSIIGNLIHPPFLIVFLALSILLCVLTVIGLPTNALAALLNATHAVWYRLLVWQPLVWWPRITWWHFICGCCMLIGTQAWHRQKKNIFITAMLCTVLTMIPLMHTTPTDQTHLTRGRHVLTCTPQTDGSIHLHDHGYISRAANTDAVMDYEVIPHLIYSYGLPRNIIFFGTTCGKRIRAAQAICQSQYRS